MSTTSTTTAPQFITQTALSATGFVDSLGVNTHMAFTGTTYTNVAQVDVALNYLGIDHVRDNLYTTSVATAGFDALAADGIKFDFTPALATNYSVNVAGFVSALTAFEAQFPGSISAIEGANEVNIWQININGTQSIANGALLQEALYTAVKADAALANIPVYNTSIGSGDPTVFAQMGNLSSYADYANAHTYVMSTSNISTALSALMSIAETDAPGKPVVITEAGYNTDTAYWYDGVDQTTQAKYTLDTLMDAYKQGVSQTYLYELFDENLGATNSESYFGLFNADGTPKLAATAIHNLTTILSDPGSSSGTTASGTLTYSLSGQPSTTQNMVLEKANGTMDLVLWAEPQVWNSTTQTDITVPVSTVTVTFATTEAIVRVYDPLYGTNPIATYTNVSQIQVGISDHPLIIEIDPGVSTSTTSSTAVLSGASTSSTALSSVSVSTDLSDTKTYNTAGVLTNETVVHADGSKDVYLSAIQNPTFVSEHDTYSSTGVLTSQVRSHLDGSLASTMTLTADGTKISDVYNMTGVLTTQLVVYTDGSTDSQAYTAGVLTHDTITHANGSRDVYTYGVQNQSYSTEHDVYNAAGALTAMTLLHQDGTLASAVMFTSTGSKLVNTYDATGVLKSSSVTNSDGSSEVQTYTNNVLTGDTIKYAAGSANISDYKVYNTSGVLIHDTITHADHSMDAYTYNIQNQSYVTEHDVYNAAGVLVSDTLLHQDGTLASSYTLATNGTKTNDSYDATGVLKSSTVTHTDGSSEIFSYTGSVLTGDTVKYAPGSANLSNAETFNTAGVLTRDIVTHTDHSIDVYSYGIQNQSYTSEHDSYSASGALTSETMFYQNGSLATNYTIASNGTKTMDNYNTSGALTSVTVSNSDGSSDSKSYTGGVLTGETVKYAAGSANLSVATTYTTAGALTHENILHADSSRDIYDMNVTGKSYTADHFAYGTAGQLLSGDITNLDGTHTQNAYAAGVTLTSAAGVADTLSGFSAGNDTFNFAAGFGHDTVTGFQLGANHDTLAIDTSEAANFQQLQLQTVGHDTLITLSANDSILVKGVVASSLTAADFHFMPHFELIA